MSAHTPGPWTLQPLEEDFPGIGDSALGHQRIVGGNCLSPGIVFGGLRECESNARLIAAAWALEDTASRIRREKPPLAEAIRWIVGVAAEALLDAAIALDEDGKGEA